VRRGPLLEFPPLHFRKLTRLSHAPGYREPDPYV
jgi:hypothetical protein